MKILEEDASFNFIDDREYVNSSSIIQYIWLSIEPYLSSHSKQDIFIDIRFHQVLKSNAKFIVFDEYQDFSEVKHIVSEGVVYTENMKLYYCLLEDVGNDVIKNEQFEYCVNIDHAGNYEGLCTIGIDDANSYISNIIEANKRVHKITQCKNSKLEIINLYMKKLPLLHITKDFEKKATLLIENLGVREHGNDITTLNRIKLPEFSDLQFDIAFLIKGGIYEQ